MKRTTISVLSTCGLAAGIFTLVAGSGVGSTPAAAGTIARGAVSSIHQFGAGSVRPDACNTKKTEPIRTAGGVFAIPSCAGTTGKITYGANNAPANSSVTLLSSATNPSPSTCGSASGETTVAYVLATGNGTGSVTYNTAAKKSTLRNAAFPRSATFTLIAYAFGVEQFSEKIGSPNAKGVLKFASPLNGMTLPLGLTFCFELATP